MSRLLLSLGRELGDTSLARGQRLGAAERFAAWAAARAVELRSGPVRKRRCAAASRELEAAAQRLAGLRALTRTPQGGAERDERLGVLEARRRGLGDEDRFAQEVVAVLAAKRAEQPQRPRKRPRSPPSPRSFQLSFQ